MKLAIALLSASLAIVGCSKPMPEGADTPALAELLEKAKQANAAKAKEGKPGSPAGIPAASSPALPVVQDEASPAPKTKPKSFATNNSISGQVAKTELAAGRYFTSLVAWNEGFRGNFYHDNSGVAVAYGFNASYQSKATSLMVGDMILESREKGQVLANLSGQFNVSPLPSISINPEQGLKMSELIKPQYENPMRAWIPGFENLTKAQQAVVTYHAYKTGAGGAMKYKTLHRKLLAVIANPTLENTQDAAKEFTYKYTINGVVKQDTRSTVYMQALFIDPEGYNGLINGKTAPSLANVPELTAQKIDVTKPANFELIPDPIGEAKLEMERTGKRLEIVPAYEYIMQVKPERKSGASFGGMFSS